MVKAAKSKTANTKVKCGQDQSQPENTKRRKQSHSLSKTSSTVEKCPCTVCKEPVTSKGIECDRCNNWVHHNCADISDHDYETIARMNNACIKFFCPPCSGISSESETEVLKQISSTPSNSNEGQITTLVQLVSTLQSQNEAILAVVGQLDEKIDKKVEEKLAKSLKEKKEERKEQESRENNIIIYNLPEADETALTSDTSQVNDLFSAIGSDLTGQKLEDSITGLSRLGKGSEGKLRPIKICFKDTSHKYTILRRARYLKGLSRFDKVGIAEDKTLQQRETERKLREELKRRKAKGENVIIFKGAIVEKRKEANHCSDAPPSSST